MNPVGGDSLRLQGLKRKIFRPFLHCHIQPTSSSPSVSDQIGHQTHASKTNTKATFQIQRFKFKIPLSMAVLFPTVHHKVGILHSIFDQLASTISFQTLFWFPIHQTCPQKCIIHKNFQRSIQLTSKSRARNAVLGSFGMIGLDVYIKSSFSKMNVESF